MKGKRALAALLALLGLAASPAMALATSRAAAAAIPQLRWLAMGDSYAAGEGTTGAGNSDWSGPGTRDHDGTCQRSNHAWAPLAYRRLNAGRTVHIAAFNFVACTGAVILGDGNQLTDQLREAGIAANQQTARYDLITLSFGGNDLGFAEIVESCLGSLSGSLVDLHEGPFGIPPFGRPPKCLLGDDYYRQQLAIVRDHLSGLFTVLEQKIAPGGHIVVLGYPLGIADPSRWTLARIDPNASSGAAVPNLAVCNGILSIDAGRLRKLGVDLNQAVATATASFSNIHFLNPAGGFEGHLLCSGGEEWINGYATLFDPTGTSKFPPKSCPLPGNRCRTYRSFHPNDGGYQYEAGQVGDLIPRLDWSHLFQPATGGTPSPTPPSTTAGCASDEEILAAARQSDPSIASFARVSDRLCDGNYVAAWIDQSASGTAVLLRREGSHLAVVAMGADPCANPAVQAQTAAVRQFFGC